MATGTVSGPALGKVLTDSRDLIGERHRPLEQALAELKKAGLTMEVTAFDGLCVFRDKKGEVVEAPTIDGLFVVKDARPVFTSYGAEDLAAEIKKLLSLKK